MNGDNNNFGELKPSSLCGYVYYDLNNDGIFQAGEAPIPGSTVTLTGTDDLGVVGPIVMLTDVNGHYCFTDLRPGTYTINENQPVGYSDGKDTHGTPGGGVPSNDQFANIPLGPGVNGDNNNFGELKPSSLCGYVYYDLNNDGIFQAGEAPIPGTTVTLTGTDDLGAVGPVVMLTDVNGHYCFTSLRPGTYTIN